MRSRDYRLAVIGDPIRHSLSPAMHTAALKTSGFAGSYTAIHVRPADLPHAIRRLDEGGYDGFNVTIPHKEAVLPLLDDVDDEAAQLGAVNTVVRRDGRFVGYNTDVTGFGRTVNGLTVHRRTAVVLGAGGSARAVVAALLGLFGRVIVANRTLERAEALAATVSSSTVPLDSRDAPRRRERGYVLPIPLSAEALAPFLGAADVVVNTTSMGMDAPDESPLPSGLTLCRNTAVFDLVYRPLSTALLRQAVASGCRTIDGLTMLVAQGADSFALWTGVRPDQTAMRAAITDDESAERVEALAVRGR